MDKFVLKLSQFMLILSIVGAVLSVFFGLFAYKGFSYTWLQFALDGLIILFWLGMMDYAKLRIHRNSESEEVS